MSPASNQYDQIPDAAMDCLEPCLFGSESLIKFQRRTDKLPEGIGWGLQKNSGKAFYIFMNELINLNFFVRVSWNVQLPHIQDARYRNT